MPLAILPATPGHACETLRNGYALALAGDRFEHLRVGIGELLHAGAFQLGGDLVEIDACLCQRGEIRARSVDVVEDGEAVGCGLGRVAERVESRVGHGGDRVLADQLVDVERRRVGGVLAAGRRPQRTLRVRSGGREALPRRAGMGGEEDVRVRELRVGHRDAAAQR